MDSGFADASLVAVRTPAERPRSCSSLSADLPCISTCARDRSPCPGWGLCTVCRSRLTIGFAVSWPACPVLASRASPRLTDARVPDSGLSDSPRATARTSEAGVGRRALVYPTERDPISQAVRAVSVAAMVALATFPAGCGGGGAGRPSPRPGPRPPAKRRDRPRSVRLDPHADDRRGRPLQPRRRGVSRRPGAGPQRQLVRADARGRRVASYIRAPGSGRRSPRLNRRRADPAEARGPELAGLRWWPRSNRGERRPGDNRGRRQLPPGTGRRPLDRDLRADARRSHTGRQRFQRQPGTGPGRVLAAWRRHRSQWAPRHYPR